MFSFLDDLYLRLNDGECAIAAFCDLTKAFDCVSHDILLSKLETYGVRRVTLSWFSSYLRGRCQKMLFGGVRSVEQGMDRGVPHGSVLEPILFLIYINDLSTLPISGTFTFFSDKLYKAAGWEPPTTRRLATEHTTFDSRHPLYEVPEPVRQLKLHKGFLSTVPIDPPEVFPLKQEPSAGSRLYWKSWKSLNRLRTGVAPVKTNLSKWGIINEQDFKYDCGATQTMEHLLVCKNCPSSCSLEYLWLAKDNAMDVAQYWADKL